MTRINRWAVASPAGAALLLGAGLAAAEPVPVLIPSDVAGEALVATVKDAAGKAGVEIDLRRAPMDAAVAAFCDIAEKKGETADLLLADRGLSNREAKLCYPGAIRDLLSQGIGERAHLTAKKGRMAASPELAALVEALTP